MEGVDDQSAITKENLIYIADFMEKSGEKHISLLGGEPLLHKNAGDIIEYLINREFNVTVFTSGIMANNRFDKFATKILSLPIEARDKLTFVVNVNEPRLSKKVELDKVYKFLSVLGVFCSLSFNIYRLDYNIDFLTEYIFRYGLKRRIRFGIANPIPGVDNQYIHPCDFKTAKTTLMSALRKLNTLNVFPILDCGFPMCIFADDDLGRLYKYTRGSVNFSCGPTIDIGPDLNCWSCFPLSNIHKRSIKDFSNLKELFSYFEKKMSEYRAEVRGIYIECDSCRYYDNLVCSGGCLAHILNRFHQEGNFRTPTDKE